jgi:AraC family transcriptional regulator, regulatory protein of adaptative response / methylated-DNA-[protein]-cysteine methyltransferase
MLNLEHDELRWQAVTCHDAEYDGQFVYAVRTTGVFCRPSCSGRPPLRKNVTFYDTPNDAQAAGYRPCKRCTPDRADFEIETTTQLCAYIDEHFDEKLTLESLSAIVHLSPDYVGRIFKRIVGVSPRQYIEARRVGQLKASLRDGHDVTSALYDAGFSSTSRLYEDASAKLGMTPATYRKGGQGMHIRYAISPCPLGYLLVGMTERGLCEVSLGDSAEAVEAWLQRDYPQAALTRDNDALEETVSTLILYLQGDAKQLGLPLDVQATAFQLRVWEALRAIPYGETRSYRQIAEALGMPTASRAVARACASNRVALVIPCHRVVREGGDLSGYRWGVERKAALLDQERRS